MKRSTKIISIVIIFFFIITAVIVARTMIGNHFKKKFSKRPPQKSSLSAIHHYLHRLRIWIQLKVCFLSHLQKTYGPYTECLSKAMKLRMKSKPKTPQKTTRNSGVDFSYSNLNLLSCFFQINHNL